MDLTGVFFYLCSYYYIIGVGVLPFGRVGPVRSPLGRRSGPAGMRLMARATGLRAVKTGLSPVRTGIGPVGAGRRGGMPGVLPVCCGTRSGACGPGTPGPESTKRAAPGEGGSASVRGWGGWPRGRPARQWLAGAPKSRNAGRGRCMPARTRPSSWAYFRKWRRVAAAFSGSMS